MSNLKELEEQFDELGHMAGYAAYLEEEAIKIHITAIALENLEREELMTVAQELKEASTGIKNAADTVKTAIDAAIARLSDNPTAADISAVVNDLTLAGETLGEAADAAAAIDPDAPGEGVVNDPANPGGVIPA